MTVLTSPVCTIDATGIHVPPMADVLAYWQAKYRSIYGADTYLEADSQDGQWVGLIAAGYNDINMACAAVYNAQSPATAQGTGLSSVVKINGIDRATSSYSTAPVLVIGQAATTITNGLISDAQGYQWMLPASVTIPLAGQITVTATCTTLGAILAPAGTITGLFTPTAGWQSVSNTADAAPGLPVQTDAQLRILQSQSTMLPSQTGMDGLVGALAALPNVASVIPYENDTGVTDANGIPPRSIALVIACGDSTAIANTVLLKKGPGTTTYGTTSVSVVDQNGIPRTINWFIPTAKTIQFNITLHPLTGFTADVEAAIQVAVAAWVNSLATGSTIAVSRAYSPANSVGSSYEIQPNGITIGVNGGSLSAADAVLAFYEDPTCIAAAVTFTIV